MKKKIPYIDLHKLSEDERIEMIGHRVIEHNQTIGFIVEDDKKADRYIRKLEKRFPNKFDMRKVEVPEGFCTVLVQNKTKVN